MYDSTVLMPALNQNTQSLFWYVRFFLQIATNFTSHLRIDDGKIQLNDQVGGLLMPVVIVSLNQRYSQTLVSTKALAGIGFIPAQGGKASHP
jgi:hypothetical protein